MKILAVLVLAFWAEPIISPSLIKIHDEQIAKQKHPVVVRRILSQYVAYAGSSDGEKYLWPVKGYITQYFGGRHTGLDLGVVTGTPCLASKSGTVEYAGWSTGYGNNVLINHGDGTKTRYAHFSRLGVKIGQVVGQGQVIGWTGSTGWSTGPHLHFEVIQGGRFQNPLAKLNEK